MANKPIAWAFRTDLTPITSRVAAALDTAPGIYGECWRSSEWIAKQVGRSVSTVVRCIRELELKGLVEIVKDYSLNSRRRILLLWREATRQPAEQPIEPAAQPELTPAPTPTPEPEKNDGKRKATPEEIAALVKKASKLGNPSSRWIKDVARRYGVRLLGKAVDHALAKGKRHFAWSVEAVKAWDAEGLPKGVTEDDADVDARIDKWDQMAADIERLWGPDAKLTEMPELAEIYGDKPHFDGPYWKEPGHAEYERRLDRDLV